MSESPSNLGKKLIFSNLDSFCWSRSFGFALPADLCEISVQREKGMFSSSFHSPPPRPVVCSTRGGDSWFSARPTWERHLGWIRRWASPGPPPRTRSSNIWKRNAILLWERNKWKLVFDQIIPLPRGFCGIFVGNRNFEISNLLIPLSLWMIPFLSKLSLE